MIALALSCRPKSCWPTSRRRRSTHGQIQILLLLASCSGTRHGGDPRDPRVGVAVEVADRVAVMYGGRLVETGPGSTRFLRGARCIPISAACFHLRRKNWQSRGQPARDRSRAAPPDLAALPPGCSFAPRCKFVQPDCVAAPPDLLDATGRSHLVRCVGLIP